MSKQQKTQVKSKLKEKPDKKKQVSEVEKVNPILHKLENYKIEQSFYKDVLCLSDSDYDLETEDVDINEHIFYKHLDNGFTNYDSDNNDDIVREFNDTESLDSTSNIKMNNKYDSDDEEYMIKKINKSKINKSKAKNLAN